MTTCPLCEAQVRRQERRAPEFGNRRVSLMVAHDVYTSTGETVVCQGSGLTYEAALELSEQPQRGAA